MDLVSGFPGSQEAEQVLGEVEEAKAGRRGWCLSQSAQHSKDSKVRRLWCRRDVAMHSCNPSI